MKERMHQLKHIIERGITMFQDNDMKVYSGNATLYIVTAMPPFIMLIISIVNLFPGYSTKDMSNVLFQILPDLAPIKKMVVSVIMNLKNQSGGLLASAAAVTTLWSASKGVRAIQKGLNQLDRRQEKNEETGKSMIKEKGKTYLKNNLKRLMFTLVLVILIPALLVFGMLGDSIAEAVCDVMEKLGPEGLNDILDDVDSFFHVSSLIVILFALLVILQMYAALPLKQRTLKSQFPGALFTCLTLFAFTKIFSIFIPRFYNASRLYGSLASIFVILLWLRFVLFILFAGSVLNHVLEEMRSEDEPRQ